MRIVPVLGAEGYKTYELSAPVQTHYRPATCEEVGCLAHAKGWSTKVPKGSDLEATVRSSGRHFVEVHVEGEIVFLFEPGQRCFRASTHRVALERDPILLVRGGDWRGNPRGTPTRVHTRSADWVDDFANHADRIARDRS